MKKPFLPALWFAMVLCFCVHTASAQAPPVGERDQDYADFACLTPEQQQQFRGPANAVCRIVFTKSDGTTNVATGVLVNNTIKDGRLLILTAAHVLPKDGDSNYLPLAQMNEQLKINYRFSFFYERGSCGTDNSPYAGAKMNGAKITGIYSNKPQTGNSFDTESENDIALLELLEAPNSSKFPSSKSLFFAGWNVEPNGGLPDDVGINEQAFLQAGLLINCCYAVVGSVPTLSGL